MTPIIGITASSITASTLGNFESIATATVGSGGAANVQFTSIPSTYTHLQVRGYIRANDDWSYRFNGDTGTNYSAHFHYGQGTTVTSGNLIPVSRGYIGYGDTNNDWGGFILDILDYKNTNKNTTTRSLAGFDRNGGGFMMFNSSVWRNTSAVTSILIYATGGNLLQYSHFALYGIK